MFCRHCGASNHEDAQFCYGCGKEIQVPPLAGAGAGSIGTAGGSPSNPTTRSRPWLLPGIIVLAIGGVILVTVVVAGLILYPRLSGKGGVFGSAATANDLASIPAADLVAEIDVPQLSKAVGSWVEGERDTKALYEKYLEELRREMLKDGVDLGLVERVSIAAWRPADPNGPRVEYVAYVVGRFDTSRFEWSSDETKAPLSTSDDIRIVELKSRHGVGAIVGPGAFYIGSSQNAVRRAIDARAGREASADSDSEARSFRDSLGSSQALRVSILPAATIREILARAPNDPDLARFGTAASLRYIGAALDVSQGCKIEVEVRTSSSAAAAAVPADAEALLDATRPVPEIRGTPFWRAFHDAMTVRVEGNNVRVSVAKPQAEVVSLFTELFTRGRAASEESSAIGTLRSIGSAQATFQARSGGRSASLNELAASGFLDESLRDGAIRNGFRFTTVRASGAEWDFKAEPVDPARHDRAFNISTDFVIRYRLGSVAPEGTTGTPIG